MSCILFQTTGGSGSPYWGDAVADFASLPLAGGTTGQIVQTLDTTYLYRWNSSSWDLYFDGGFVDPMTTNGDIIIRAAGVAARLGIGSPGQVLTVSGANLPSWAAASGTGDVVGPASATDTAIALFNTTTGKLIKNSVVTIDVAGIMSGATQLNVDNLRLDGNTISSLDANGNILLDPNGTGFVGAESRIRIPEIATPSTPASGYGVIYFKSDGNLYQLNDAGAETNLANATGVSDTNFVAYTSPGYGSTATRIFRFTTVEVNNLGGNVTYTSSSVNGDSWTINVEGLYTFTFMFESSDPNREAGITLNQSSLTTNITANPESEQLVSGSCIASRRTPVSVTRWLPAGSVIRACGDGGTVATGTGDHRFCINKIG